MRPNVYDTGFWILMGLALFLVLLVHLVPALLVGLAVYELVQFVVQTLNIVQIRRRRAKLMAIGLVGVGVVAFIGLAGIGIVSFLQTDRIPMLISKLADSLDSWRGVLPNSVAEQVPASVEDLRQMVVEWLPLHVGQLKEAGAEVARVTGEILFAFVIGVLASLHEYEQPESSRPLAKALMERVGHLGESFHRVVFAQIRIAALNTFLTAVNLGLVLPAFHVHLPFLKTMIIFTFLVGLFPIVGNLRFQYGNRGFKS